MPGTGLISLHDYSILRAVEYKGKRFLRIRNPWANSEWTGPWSDGSKEWTREATKEWRGVLDVLQHEFDDDGAFIMEYEDFLKVWTIVERTQLFDTTWIQSSHWLNVTCRAAPCAWQYGDVSCTPNMFFHMVHNLSKSLYSYIQLAETITRNDRPFPSRLSILERPLGVLVLVNRLFALQKGFRACDRPICYSLVYRLPKRYASTGPRRRGLCFACTKSQSSLVLSLDPPFLWTGTT